MYDIIPDIHGQYDKLKACLEGLGYHHRDGAWRNVDPSRTVIFLGDFIDRGQRNGDVLKTVREMVEAGTASAVMGNHELNAIMYHRTDPKTGEPLRRRDEKNTQQHASFLEEFPLGSDAANEWIDWMATLPICGEYAGFRVVHACWDQERVSKLLAFRPDARLSEDDFVTIADRAHPLCDIVETLTKGPETRLPEGFHFEDKDGSKRKKVRLQWWKAGAGDWRDIAMSVPDIDSLPLGPAPEEITKRSYPANDIPVFFGHYWMSGDVQPQASNALCLDYSAGRDGPLVSYLIDDSHRDIDLKRVSAFG